jgi:transposase InsO family protein
MPVKKRRFELRVPGAGIRGEAARRLRVQHIADLFTAEDNPGGAGGMHCRSGPDVGSARIGGRKFRTLQIEDARRRAMPTIEVDTSLAALRAVRVLERLRQERGLPERIVIDHGTEFTSKVLDQWAYENKVTLHFITPGRPMENGCAKSLRGRFRGECLNEH